MYLNEYDCGIYFNKVWNCPEFTVESEKENCFWRIFNSKTSFLFCIFMNMNLALFQHLTPTTMAICFFNSNEPSPNQNYVKIVKISCIKTKPKRPEKNNKKWISLDPTDNIKTLFSPILWWKPQKLVKNRRNSWKIVKIKEIREKNTFFVKIGKILVPNNPTSS